MDPFIREGPRAQVVRHGAQGHEGDDTTQARHSCEGDDTTQARHSCEGDDTTQARHSCEGDSYDTGPPFL
jgi:hypothetical protein